MDTLPTEVVSHIISFLDLRCQLRLSAVSVRWREAVSDCLRRRQRLELADSTDAELRTLLPQMPALKALQVGVAGGLPLFGSTEFDVDIVADNCPRLEKLDLMSFRLDADSLERLCRRCPRLCDVRLPRDCSSELLELLLRRLPGMRALHLVCTDVSAAAIALMPAGLERLKLAMCRVRPSERQPADRWPVDRDLADGLAALLSVCPKLTALHVHATRPELGVDVVSQNCPHLEKLDLRSFRLDAVSLERLCRRCPRLWDVRLPRGCRSELLELLLLRLPGLRALRLHNTAVSRAATALLPASLERLQLRCSWLHSCERQPAGRWPRLTELVLIDMVGDDSAGGMTGALVTGCPRLQRLEIFYSDADDYLLHLLPSSHLQHLKIVSCTRITEDGLASGLGRLRQLRTLDLLNMPCVTDRVLDSLAGAPSLTKLKLGVVTSELGMQVTMEALQRLIETCPSLSSVELALRENKQPESLMKHSPAQQLESLIAGLSDRLDRGRDVTLAIPSLTLQKLPKSVLPSETSPLRLASLY